MTTHFKTLVAPILENREGQALPDNKISVSKNSAGVVINVDTTSFAQGTELTAHFSVITGVVWSELKLVEGSELKFILGNANFKLHVGKTATINYSIESNDSEVVVAPIVG
ncbi:hypothetical protein [Pseudomonas fluorescens]|uniref:Uncharacterized protein n=1 Tax=Pseudomonas fluorescens TaxID=294 RepID=A0A5E7PP90_PSEFL|nr:hypothetical protein [Pseudomonas fluorescens]VVP48943.1 hypothetical protein PS880_05249 [Pseudomonas fluorescens]